MKPPIFDKVLGTKSTEDLVVLSLGTTEAMSATLATTIDGANTIAAALTLEWARVTGADPMRGTDTTFPAKNVSPAITDTGEPVLVVTLGNGSQLSIEFAPDDLRDALTTLLALTARPEGRAS